MSNFSTSPMNQLMFAWPEEDSPSSVAPVGSHSLGSAIVATTIPLGIAAPTTTTTKPSRTTESKIIPGVAKKEIRRGRPEHISDLLLVVLDRYGISPEEFLAGLQ